MTQRRIQDLIEFILSMFVIYLLFSFIECDLNISHWKVYRIIIYVIVSPLLSYTSIVIKNIKS